MLVTMSTGEFRFFDGVLTIQKYSGLSFLDRALGIFACAAIVMVPPLVFVSSSGVGKSAALLGALVSPGRVISGNEVSGKFGSPCVFWRENQVRR